MNVAGLVKPLPIPQLLNQTSSLKLMLGLGLFFAGLLIFSLWKERLLALQEDQRTKFLMYNFVGGTWVIAVFAVCGGVYFLFDSVMQFST